MASQLLSRFFSLRRALRPAAERARTGATAVEMALLLAPFFYMIIGVTELSLVLTTQQLLENAAFNATRLAKTGYTATGQTQLSTVMQIVDNELQSFGSFIDITKVSMTESTYSSFAAAGAGGGASGLGTQQQIVVYSITYPWKLFTPMMGMILGKQDSNGNWVFNVTSQIVVRNEPYG